ncbi:beta-lactamase-like protein [Aspergillus crustosus]
MNFDTVQHPPPKPIAQKDDLEIYTYHAPPIPLTYQNTTNLTFSPTTFTLITTTTAAVLVDAPLYASSGHDLANWIESTVPGQNLTAIYITHAHGDHFFAIPTLQERSPGVKVLATPEVYAHLKQQLEPAFFASFWATLFPDLEAPVLKDISILEDLGPSLTFHLDSGHGKHATRYPLHAVEVGEWGHHQLNSPIHPISKKPLSQEMSCTETATSIWPRSPTAEPRKQWLQGIEKVAALKPEVVVPSPALPGEGYGSGHLDETREYIQYFERVLEEAGSWEEVEGASVEAFPERQRGGFILRFSAQSFFGVAF